jgi:hypothetical protein
METTRYYTIVNQAIVSKLKEWQIRVDGTTAMRSTFSESIERKQMIAVFLKNGDLKYETRRDSYNAIIKGSLSETIEKQVINLFNEAAAADKVDEHGTWDFGAEFDRKGRGSALNWDLYGVGKDIHSKKLLIVIQVRQYVKAHKGYFPQIRKSYFLIGRNEDNHAFAHSVESRVIHDAINKGKDVIKAVQDWIFGCDYKKVIRQGDLAMIPVKRLNPAAVALEGEKHLIENSHELTSADIRKNGELYAIDPLLIHLPGTHPTVQAQGWYKIVVGKRASHWDFAAPTID